MKCIVLAAGYATRLYPLTENFPKPLLEVQDKTILDWLLDDIDSQGKIDEYIVVSNHRYAAQFEQWAAQKKLSALITVLDDGSVSNETRLGAVRDVQLAIEHGQLDDDLLVIAGDNVLDFSLGKFINYFEKKRHSCVMRYYEADMQKLKRCGVAEVEGNGRVFSMEEKPAEPKGNWCIPPFYIYAKEDVHKVYQGLEQGCGVDAPGSFIAWLCGQTEVYAMPMPGKRYDIGDVQSYARVQREYEGVQDKHCVLVTGAAGFIGFHLSKRLLESGQRVVGFDNLNDYYEVSLKQDRLEQLKQFTDFSFIKGDLADKAAVDTLFEAFVPQIVVNLAAQAGVRYSIDHPQTYIESNINGFFNILEACRNFPVEHLVYASSSSVYGNQSKTPFSIDDKTDEPISLYAATKKSNELMAYAYSNLFAIPATGLRFFTVYGPYGRPDMAYFSFAKKMVKGEPIQVFNHGDMYRDFTYVDDIVTGIVRVMDKAPKANADGVRARVYNIGNNKPERLMHFIETLEKALGAKAVIELLPMQLADVYKTYADIEDLEQDFGFAPSTSIEEGLTKFADWFLEYYDGQ